MVLLDEYFSGSIKGISRLEALERIFGNIIRVIRLRFHPELQGFLFNGIKSVSEEFTSKVVNFVYTRNFI